MLTRVTGLCLVDCRAQISHVNFLHDGRYSIRLRFGIF